MRWLLCDYGGVLSLDQPEADKGALAGLGGMAGAEFWATYWRHRPAYDRADLTVVEYWAAVLGRRPAPALVRALVEADVGSWCHPNLDVLAAAGRAEDRGFRLAVLSNAPIEVARALDHLPWLAGFRPRLFSCDLGAIKPEPAIYRSVVGALDAGPRDVVFFDDREDNVAAAAALGIEAHLYRNPSQFDQCPL